MKAIEILKWVCRESINGEHLGIVQVPEEGEHEWEQNEDWWLRMFGSLPPAPIESGEYLYMYESTVSNPDIYDSFNAYQESDVEIELPTDYGFDYIKFYKID